MDNILSVIVPVLLAVNLLVLVLLLFRKPRVHPGPADDVLRSVEKSHERTERSVREEIARNREEWAGALRQSREELAQALKNTGDTLNLQLSALTQTNDRKLEALRGTVEERLTFIRDDNARQLQQMREVVDERLQGTLERRLDDSFKQVSDRLEQVYRGLGEMQTLAAGVGDLKRVLTNVKTRGTWGEVQLWAILDQVLTPDQYARNMALKDGNERVEFAVRLPGRGDDGHDTVWLPIDAKFPIEDYHRLLDAQEKADAVQAEFAARQIEVRIRQCARDICEKYLNPPRTTDFGILFLPVEGLFAEVIRRTGLPESVQRECKVVIAGPATLWSILNSLQVGFKTLAIEKRTSEVWALLAAVKTEWARYAEILSRVQKKLREASDTLDKAQVRTRAIGKKLKDVQELPSSDAPDLLMIKAGGQEEEIGEA